MYQRDHYCTCVGVFPSQSAVLMMWSRVTSPSQCKRWEGFALGGAGYARLLMRYDKFKQEDLEKAIEFTGALSMTGGVG